GRVFLVPDDPRDGVVRTGEGDVGLDARARRVDVERGIAGGEGRRLVRVQPPEADQLPAEPVQVDPARGLGAVRTGDVRDGLLECLLDEDLPPRRVVVWNAVVLLPGDPGHGIVSCD